MPSDAPRPAVRPATPASRQNAAKPRAREREQDPPLAAGTELEVRSRAASESKMPCAPTVAGAAPC